MARRFLGAAALAVASATGLLLLLSTWLQTGGAGVRTPDEAVTLGVLAIGALLLVWYLATALVALACLAARAAGRAWSAGERRLSGLGAPFARRLLLTSGSAAVAAAATFAPAVAAPAPEAPAPVVMLADDLGWGASEEEPQGGEHVTNEPDDEPEDEPDTAPEQRTPPGHTAEPASSSTAVETHTVAAGDSLWAIATDHLPATATAAEIAAAWPEWYSQNRDLIGDDPDLIHPGQVLTAPGHDPEEEA